MYNKIMLMGRLTKIPECKSLTNGNSVTNISIAVERSYKKDGEERKTDFFNCVAYGTTADFINKYFSKGNMIFIDGQIENRTYEKDGKIHYVTEIFIDTVSFTGEKKS